MCIHQLVLLGLNKIYMCLYFYTFEALDDEQLNCFIYIENADNNFK